MWGRLRFRKCIHACYILEKQNCHKCEQRVTYQINSEDIKIIRFEQSEGKPKDSVQI